MALSSVRNCPSSWRVLYPAVLSRRPGSELPMESVCANLRCIEAGFVDLCRLIYHGHHCIRNKILRWGPVKKKGKQIILFSSTSSAVSRLHQSLKTLENNPTPSSAEVHRQKAVKKSRLLWQSAPYVIKYIFRQKYFSLSSLNTSANMPMETLVQRINKTSVQCLIIHESISLTSSVQSKKKVTQEQAEKKNPAWGWLKLFPQRWALLPHSRSWRYGEAWQVLLAVRVGDELCYWITSSTSWKLVS